MKVRITFALSPKCMLLLKKAKIETGMTYGSIMEKALMAHVDGITQEAVLDHLKLSLPDIDRALIALSTVKARLEND